MAVARAEPRVRSEMSEGAASGVEMSQRARDSKRSEGASSGSERCEGAASESERCMGATSGSGWPSGAGMSGGSAGEASAAVCGRERYAVLCMCMWYVLCAEAGQARDGQRLAERVGGGERDEREDDAEEAAAGRTSSVVVAEVEAKNRGSAEAAAAPT